MSRANLTGPWGEALAVEYLRGKHFKILAVGYRSRFGEIDVIAKNKTHIVFVEVKLRKSDKFAAAKEFVNHQKQDRLRVTASIYLSQNPSGLQPRFDVIEIYAPRGVETEKPQIAHMEDAFQ